MIKILIIFILGCIAFVCGVFVYYMIKFLRHKKVDDYTLFESYKSLKNVN